MLFARGWISTRRKSSILSCYLLKITFPLTEKPSVGQGSPFPHPKSIQKQKYWIVGEKKTDKHATSGSCAVSVWSILNEYNVDSSTSCYNSSYEFHKKLCMQENEIKSVV